MGQPLIEDTCHCVYCRRIVSADQHPIRLLQIRDYLDLGKKVTAGLHRKDFRAAAAGADPLDRLKKGLAGSG